MKDSTSTAPGGASSMTLDEALIVLAAQANRGSPAGAADAYRQAWPQYAVIDAVCAFLRWGAID